METPSQQNCNHEYPALCDALGRHVTGGLLDRWNDSQKYRQLWCDRAGVDLQEMERRFPPASSSLHDTYAKNQTQKPRRKPEKRIRAKTTRQTSSRFWHSCTMSCGFLGEITHKEPCNCGGSRKVELHECRLLKTKRGYPRSCVPLKSDYGSLPKDVKPSVICCEDCEHRAPPAWISKAKLLKDTDRLIQMLPEGITAVAGHARSGMLPATIVSMALHVPIYMIRSDKDHRDIIQTGNGWRLNAPKKQTGTLLVVDDNCMTGNSLTRLRPLVKEWSINFDKVIESVVYLNPLAQHQPDIHVELVPWPSYYEWNFFNSTFSGGFALDFDGILCREPTQEEVHNPEKYAEFLRTAEPKYLPKRQPVKMIVTGRQEKHREQTLAWLQRNGVHCDNLVMHPDRKQTFQSIVELKVKSFDEFRGTSISKRFGEHVFVESNDRQAQAIAQKTGGMVICPTSEKVYRK